MALVTLSPDSEMYEQRKYLPFTIVLVRMLSPKLSCTAKLSPCKYCNDAHPEIDDVLVQVFNKYTEYHLIVYYRG